MEKLWAHAAPYVFGAARDFASNQAMSYLKGKYKKGRPRPAVHKQKRRLTATMKRKRPGQRYRGRSSSGRANAAQVVTRQRDWSAGTTTKRKKRRGRGASLARKKRVRFARRIKKIVGPPKTILKLYTSTGRSYPSLSNGQSVIQIPIVSYRGANTNSTSVASAGAASQIYQFRSDHLKSIYDFYDQILAPSGGATNAFVRDWWFRVSSAAIDITMTNTGGATDLSNNPIEYEMYLTWPRKNITDIDQSTNSMADFVSAARIYNEDRIGSTTGIIGPTNALGDPAWKPWTTAGVSTWMKSKYLGRGYIELGQSVRFQKSMKMKFFTSAKKWSDDDNNLGNQLMAAKRGAYAAILIVFRGTPVSGTNIGGYPRSRMTVNVNHEFTSWTRNAMVPPGSMDTTLFANNFA